MSTFGKIITTDWSLMIFQKLCWVLGNAIMSSRIILYALIKLEMRGGRHTKGTSIMRYKNSSDGGTTHNRTPEIEFSFLSETCGHTLQKYFLSENPWFVCLSPVTFQIVPILCSNHLSLCLSYWIAWLSNNTLLPPLLLSNHPIYFLLTPSCIRVHGCCKPVSSNQAQIFSPSACDLNSYFTEQIEVI